MSHSPALYAFAVSHVLESCYPMTQPPAMSYQMFNKDYNIILPPPVQKVVLPPPSQIWDYRLSNQIQLNYSTNGQTAPQGQQQQHIQHHQQQQHHQQLQQLQMQMQMPQMNYITSPSLTNTGTTNTSPSPTSTPLSEQPHLSYHGSGLLGSYAPTTSPPSSSITSHPAIKRSSSTSSSSISKQKTKPRKKKQCPECHLFFSNLSTHKSIHLNPSSRPFLCQVCGRGFSRSNDLFRHNKRHWRETGVDQGAFKCPFNSALLEKYHPELAGHYDTVDQMACHPTGVFSRCDTYKNHLKALHFEYPAGTKKKMRNLVGGKCKHCGKSFGSVNEWLDLHVDTGECGWDFHDHDEHDHDHDEE